MRAEQLYLRCYAERKQGGVWIAVCVDLCLASQANSLAEAKQKLHSQVHEYVTDALVGDDRMYWNALMSRKAPLSYRLRYEWLRRKQQIAKKIRKVLSFLGEHKKGISSNLLNGFTFAAFSERLPVIPAPVEQY